MIELRSYSNAVGHQPSVSAMRDYFVSCCSGAKSNVVLVYTVNYFSIFKVLGWWMRGRRVHLYFHEPYSFWFRIRENGFRGLLEGVYFWLILFFCEACLVDNAAALARARLVGRWAIGRRQYFIAPLMFPLAYSRMAKGIGVGQKDVALVGRVDEARSLSDFYTVTKGHRTFVLTSSQLGDNESGANISSGRAFSNEEKIEVLRLSDLVYCYIGAKYNQSGAVVSSLAFGRPVVVSRFEPWADVIQQLNLGVVVSECEVGPSAISRYAVTGGALIRSLDKFFSYREEFWSRYLKFVVSYN